MTSAAVQNHNGIRAFAASVPNVSFFPFFLSPSDMPRRNQEKWGGREIWNEARIADAAQAELNAMDVLFFVVAEDSVIRARKEWCVFVLLSFFLSL